MVYRMRRGSNQWSQSGCFGFLASAENLYADAFMMIHDPSDELPDTIQCIRSTHKSRDVS